MIVYIENHKIYAKEVLEVQLNLTMLHKHTKIYCVSIYTCSEQMDALKLKIQFNFQLSKNKMIYLCKSNKTLQEFYAENYKMLMKEIELLFNGIHTMFMD